jgi:hypothetical protein
VLPSKYFGANAAWLRLAVISYNVLTALKRLALPADLLRARPKASIILQKKKRGVSTKSERRVFLCSA